MTRRSRPGLATRAVAYVRVSTDGQRLEQQRDEISQWAAQKGITIVSWHEDFGVSRDAPVAERPGLQAALAALRPSNAGLMVSLNRNRVTGDSLIAALVERAARDAGAVWVTVQSGGSTGNSPTDVFTRRILDASAEYELATIRARTRAALQAKRVRGERTGGLPPYGWKAAGERVPHPTIPGRFLPQRLEPNPEEQRTIETARQLRDQHGWSLRDITRELRELGLTSRVGKPFALTQVARMLSADRPSTASSSASAAP